MDEQQLRLVVLAVVAQTAVEGNIHCPLTHVGLGNAAVQHAFKLHAELEGNVINIVGVGEDDVLAEPDL